ncbi:protein brambleberry-like [Diadema setosum]|uniref:protein brambleberry-like n=1 Tax=Diadema setosum TaxID=31175 RepID=UPI003B3B7E79
MKAPLMVLVVILAVLICDADAFLSWIFGRSDQQDDASSPQSTTTAAGPARRVPFEIKSADERFLGTGKELMAGLSELDTCHHTVVYQLKASCNDMTEEEIAKLGVRLLNCQSQAEGRPTYKCTDDMTVADCTSGMDPNTWNAYHIVSNRARSVCYSVRQQQFQRQTQFAVNQLALSAEGQLHLMENLKNGQEELGAMATDTLQTISEGQEKLVKTQEALGSSQARLKVSVESNIRDLTREKALIAAGHQELAEMTDNIKHQLDEATRQLLDQDLDQAAKHQELLKDLSSLSRVAQDVWDKLDHNMEYMHTYQEEAAHHYQHTLENLRKMNETIAYLLHVMEEMQAEINQQLGWVTSLLKWTGENMAVLVTCTLHSIYFFLAAVLSSFLQTPFFSRLVLLLIVPLNAAAEMKNGTSLDFPALSFFIVAVVMANWLALWICSYRRKGVERIEAKKPVTLYLPDISHIHGSPGSGLTLTYDPSSLSSDSCSSPTVHHRLHSTGYTSMLTEGARDMSSVLMESQKKKQPAADISRDETFRGDMNDTGDDKETESDFTSDEEEDTLDMTSRRTLTVTNLSTNADPTPMPNEQSTMGNAMSFGATPNLSVTKRQLGPTLEQVQLATPSPSQRGRRSGTPSSSRSSSPSRRPCSGLTKAGLPCRLPCASGRDFCYRHAGTPTGSLTNTPAKAN